LDEDTTPSPQPFDTAPPPTTLPFGGEPPTTLPFGEPMGDADLPPAPPFAAPVRTPSRAAAAPVTRPGHRTADRARPADLPPGTPIAMAWTN
jgi:protein transport protein SEC31